MKTHVRWQHLLQIKDRLYCNLNIISCTIKTQQSIPGTRAATFIYSNGAPRVKKLIGDLLKLFKSGL